MILIKGGRVVDPKSKTDALLDVVLDAGKIVKLGTDLDADGDRMPYERILDASGMTVAPGLIDVHVHFRDPGLTYKEDIHTGAKAAAKGGYTTVVCMANTKPVVDNAETLKYVLEEGEKRESTYCPPPRSPRA